MTYCVALRLEAGMIFASDTRTNAGVDQVATFTKMRVFEKPGDRVVVTLTSVLTRTDSLFSALVQNLASAPSNLELP